MEDKNGGIQAVEFRLTLSSLPLRLAYPGSKKRSKPQENAFQRHQDISWWVVKGKMPSIHNEALGLSIILQTTRLNNVYSLNKTTCQQSFVSALIEVLELLTKKIRSHQQCISEKVSCDRPSLIGPFEFVFVQPVNFCRSRMNCWCQKGFACLAVQSYPRHENL